ncbi:helix-turn-helix domain-containing protein [Ruminococcus sp.]|uniref:helix-turn-helix domain-containing protein n=1 Tax=Ruminococcus sp. TaxID=41978 RepID=UPI0038903011
MATFEENITKLRNDLKKRRQEVADDLGISRSSLEYYEKGKRRPDIEVLAKLADYYGVSTDYLIGRTNAKTTNKKWRFVCEYTGLSDNAVAVLHEGKSEDNNSNNHDSYHEFIEFILDEKNTVTVLSFLFHLRMYRDRTKEYQENLRETIQEAEQILEDIDNVKPEVIQGFIDRFSDDREKEKDYAEFRLQKSIKRLYEDFGNDIYTVNESEEEIKKLMHLNLTITDEYLKRYESEKEGEKHGNDPET